MWGPGRVEHLESYVGGPLEEGAQIVAVGVQGASAVPGQERGCGQIGLIERVGGREGINGQ